MIAVSQRRFAQSREVLEQACGRAFTGAVARIQYGGCVVFESAYGRTRDDALAQPVYVDTRFDLASITKLFVSTIALDAVARGLVTLDGPLLDVVPEWRASQHETITLRALLAHVSGMHSGADYRMLLGHDIISFTLERPLAAPPNERVIYSDLGFIALGTILERVERRALSDLLGRFVPSSTLAYGVDATHRLAIPATEDDGWRGRVQGVVHDEKAYLLGGVAGHAGLFGTAADVAWLAEHYLAVAQGRVSRMPASLAKEAVREQAFDPVLRRGLGWALKTSDENSCGRYWSRETFGHTGFVGTCVWADPQRDVQAVLLTNSVYFGRNDTRDLRAAFYEAVLGDLDLR